MVCFGPQLLILLSSLEILRRCSAAGLNQGHWRCWDAMLRQTSSLDVVTHDPTSKALYHLRIKATRQGFPFSDLCCSSWFGPSGNPRCWIGDYTFQTCCSVPQPPHRCHGDQAHVLLVDPASSTVVGAALQELPSVREPHGSRGTWDSCASLDEFAVFFSDPIIGGADRHKEMHDYLQFYEQRLQNLGMSASLLEIGVNGGHSLAMWSLWFPLGMVIGVDIQTAQFSLDNFRLSQAGANISGNVKVLQFDSTSPRLLRHLPKGTAFDVIIDDGSHAGEDQVATFQLLFLSKLKPGGWYMIEDVEDEFVYGFFSRYFLNDGLSMFKERFRSSRQLYDMRHKHAQSDWTVWVDELVIRMGVIMIHKMVLT